jgi:hypothetical protein
MSFDSPIQAEHSAGVKRPKGRDGVRNRHALKFKPRAQRESTVRAPRPAVAFSALTFNA